MDSTLYVQMKVRSSGHLQCTSVSEATVGVSSSGGVQPSDLAGQSKQVAPPFVFCIPLISRTPFTGCRDQVRRWQKRRKEDKIRSFESSSHLASNSGSDVVEHVIARSHFLSELKKDDNICLRGHQELSSNSLPALVFFRQSLFTLTE